METSIFGRNLQNYLSMEEKLEEKPLTIDLMKALKRAGYRELVAKGQFGSMTASFVPVREPWDQVTEEHPEDFQPEDFVILLVKDNFRTLCNQDVSGMSVKLDAGQLKDLEEAVEH